MSRPYVIRRWDTSAKGKAFFDRKR